MKRFRAVLCELSAEDVLFDTDDTKEFTYLDIDAESVEKARECAKIHPKAHNLQLLQVFEVQ
ncbi:MAG: hypothetical protein COU90_04140 [Candidatus Ryanbacteria bacterium CG10_big_fil_rev_8_21_14_0_10_43_42]|uniref:Uncharacterized protein n=1 Tax=Candidatus Ryanbacteria bacterium CG10_big_fil_rev_8_21_14_0_10_43_42 TaxID=1974864 RepID=A0A2M8KW54_9BACT|nr:MAG: hypothetical protein COU90_04140 [Candidatus Ryanbacteria bacterium CG10_big_fil_rev_8_21_14_0_10_43_42]